MEFGHEGWEHTIISENWPLADKYSDAVYAAVAKDLRLGKKLRSFSDPNFENIISSPMGAFLKKGLPSKYRIVNDLSYPQSVNDFISPECFSLTYVSG